MKMSQAQYRNLVRLVDHIYPTQRGPQSFKGLDSFGPRKHRDVPTWNWLEKQGLVVRYGSSRIDSGNFSWTMPTYRITDAGRTAVAAEQVRRGLGTVRT